MRVREEIDPALLGEILGAPVTIERAPGFARLPVRGTIVDETMRTLLVRSEDGAHLWRVPKAGAQGTLLLGGRSVAMTGELLAGRPEDRTKRLAWPGRRGRP